MPNAQAQTAQAQTAQPHNAEAGDRRPFTVACGFNDHNANTVTVLATSPEEACQLAIEKANDEDGWKRTDHAGDTYVDAIAEGDGVDPWRREDLPEGGWTVRPAMPVPPAYAEPPTVTVTLSGGVVQDVAVSGIVQATVIIRDLDEEGGR